MFAYRSFLLRVYLLWVQVSVPWFWGEGKEHAEFRSTVVHTMELEGCIVTRCWLSELRIGNDRKKNLAAIGRQKNATITVDYAAKSPYVYSIKKCMHHHGEGPLWKKNFQNTNSNFIYQIFRTSINRIISIGFNYLKGVFYCDIFKKSNFFIS